jgi:hypothetical protein
MSYILPGDDVAQVIELFERADTVEEVRAAKRDLKKALYVLETYMRDDTQDALLTARMLIRRASDRLKIATPPAKP